MKSLAKSREGRRAILDAIKEVVESYGHDDDGDGHDDDSDKRTTKITMMILMPRTSPRGLMHPDIKPPC